MLRYKLRTLMIVLALGPPVLALAWFALPYLGGRLRGVAFFLALMWSYALLTSMIDTLSDKPAEDTGN